jgi:hypothetical protein
VSKIVPVNDIDDKNEDLTRPRCLEGERAGPMEDSGGPWGYADMLEILKDPNHKDYENIYEWAGDFDPEYFSLEKVNARLEVIFKPQPKKPKKSSAGKTKKPK